MDARNMYRREINILSRIVHLVIICKIVSFLFNQLTNEIAKELTSSSRVLLQKLIFSRLGN